MKKINRFLLQATVMGLMSTTAIANSGMGIPAPAPAPAAPAGLPFTGFFAGGQAGYAYAIVENPCVTVATGQRTSFDRYNSNGFVGGLHAGYGYQSPNCWYVGLELAGNVYTNKDKLDSGNRADFFKHSVKHSIAINPRLGYVFNGCALAYFKVGFELTRWNHAIDHNLTGNRFSKTKYEPGFAPGIGFAYLINQHIMIGLEGSFVFYSKEPKVRNLEGMDHYYTDHTADFKLRISFKF